MTPWVKRLLIANVAVFLLQMAYPELTSFLEFRAATFLSAPWTVVTYMFAHGGFFHVFFNMLVLYFFGPRVEARLGSNRFISLYLISGLTGALASAFTPLAAIIGASGAVFGVELAYARYWPRDQIFIWGVIPIQVRWLVVITIGMSLAGIGYGFQPGVAHFAHLGGLAGAAAYLFYLERATTRRVRATGFRVETKPQAPRGDDMRRWSTIPRTELHEINRQEVDRLLDKISAKGIASLTPSERAALDRFSRPVS